MQLVSNLDQHLLM